MVSIKLAVLLLSLLVVGATSRQLKGINSDNAEEHQRILAELEAVHQLRERMCKRVSSQHATTPFTQHWRARNGTSTCILCVASPHAAQYCIMTLASLITVSGKDA